MQEKTMTGMLVRRPKTHKYGREPLAKTNPQEYGDSLVSGIRDAVSLLQTIKGVELPGQHLLAEKAKLERTILRNKRALEKLVAKGQYRPPNV